MKSRLLLLGVLASAVFGQPRAVELSAPADESAFRTGSDITLTARCSADFAVVRFFVDSASIGEAPCGASFVWKSALAGIHAISASAGIESEPVLVFVNDAATRPRVESVQGVVQAVVEDRFEQRTSHTYYSLLVNGASIPIALPTSAIHAAAQSGKPTALEGFRGAGRFYPRMSVGTVSEAATPSLAALGTRSVAVILINYLNQTSQPITKAQAASLLDTVGRYYKEASYGQYSVVGDVYGYLSLPISEICTNGTTDGSNLAFDAITTAGIEAAKNAGLDLSPYQSYFFIGPTATQCFGGYATIGGSPGRSLIPGQRLRSRRGHVARP